MEAALELSAVVLFFVALAALSARRGAASFGHEPSKEELLAECGLTWDDLRAQPDAPLPSRARGFAGAMSAAARKRAAAVIAGLSALAVGGFAAAAAAPVPTSGEPAPVVYVAGSRSQAAGLQDYVTRGLLPRQLPPGSRVVLGDERPADSSSPAARVFDLRDRA